MREQASRLFAVFVFTAIVTTIQTASADVFTDPVGFVTLSALGTNNVPGPSSQGQYITLAALGMTQLPASRGNATAVSTSKVGVNSTLTAGQFGRVIEGTLTNVTHFIELTSGTCAGFQTDIISNDTASVYTDIDLTSCLGAGATYKIYPHWTIGKIFGPNNEAGLLGGSASTADQVQTWSVGSQSYATTYYFKTTGLGGTGWRTTANSSVNVTNNILYIDQSLYIARKVGTNVDVKVVGGVKLGPTISTVFSNGVTIIGNVYPAGQPLGASGLYTGSAATGLLGGTASTADQLQIWVPSNQAYTITYYFKTSGLGGTGWRSTANSSLDTATNTIPLGASAYVVRKPGNPTFNWVAPQPFTTP